jgi:hypothetical protein
MFTALNEAEIYIIRNQYNPVHFSTNYFSNSYYPF